MKYILYAVFITFMMGCSSEEEREYLIEGETDHWEIELSIEELPAGEDIGEEVLIIATYMNEEHTADNVRITSLSEDLNQNEHSTSSVSGIEAGDTVEQERRGSAQNSPFLGSIANQQPITITIDWHQDGGSLQETITFEVDES